MALAVLTDGKSYCQSKTNFSNDHLEVQITKRKISNDSDEVYIIMKPKVPLFWYDVFCKQVFSEDSVNPSISISNYRCTVGIINCVDYFFVFLKHKQFKYQLKLKF
jgi:hypothetical protein